VFNDVRRECGLLGKFAMSGETETGNIAFSVQ
jgi:hypothetical protein